MSDKRPSKSERKSTEEAAAESAAALASAEKHAFASEAALTAAKEAEYVFVKAAVSAADAALASAAAVLSIFDKVADGMQHAGESTEVLAAAKKDAAASEAALVSAKNDVAASEAAVVSAEKNVAASAAALISAKKAAVISVARQIASPQKAVVEELGSAPPAIFALPYISTILTGDELKVYTGLEVATAQAVGFPLVDKLNGPDGSYMKHIESNANVRASLQGRGSASATALSSDGLHISILTLDLTSRGLASLLAGNLIDTVRNEYMDTAYSCLPAAALALAGVTPNKKLFDELNVGSMSEYCALQKSFIDHEHSIPIRADYPMPRYAVNDDLKRLALEVDSFVDVRDHSGKWLPAQVKAVASLASRGAESTERGDLLLHFIGWSEQWNDVIASRIEPHRFAEFRRFSSHLMSAAAKPPTERYYLNQWVDIYAHKPTPRKWRRGKITRLYGPQCEVTYFVLPSVGERSQGGSFHRFWFPFRSDEIHPLLGAACALASVWVAAEAAVAAGAVAKAASPVERRNESKFTASDEFCALRESCPELHAVVGAIAPEYLALRQRANWIMCKAFLCPEVEIPTIRTNVASTGVMFALRQWLMQYETISEADAEVLVGTECVNASSNVIKKAVADVLETATALTKWIQTAPVPRESFVFVSLMGGNRVVLVETGFLAAAWRRCAACAKAGVRRCRRCGLVWHCSKACQIAHWGTCDPAVASECTNVEAAAVASPLVDVKSTGQGTPGYVKSVGLRASHRLTCRGPPFDRSMFRAAQLVLAEGFRPIEKIPDFNDYRWPDEASYREVRIAIYQAALLHLDKPTAARIIGSPHCK